MQNKLFKIFLLILICSSLVNSALAIDPDVLAKKALCHTCLAKIYVAQGQDPEAIKEYQELVKLIPNDAAIRFDFGNVLARNDKPDLAASQFKLAAKLKPTIPEYQVGLGNACMYIKNYEGAVHAYTKACMLGGKFEKQLQMAQQYQAQQKLLDQYKKKVQETQQAE